ncbi:MAG: type III secretion protein [Rhodobacteraceae bacterium]|nr:MAG: type III secretion protein [Paracoccaceae bacterium]
MTALEALAPFAALGEGAVYGAVAVFARVGATVALLPGFGETALPARVKLGAAVVFTMAVWPLAAPLADLAGADAATLWLTVAAEAVAGLILGLSVRMLIFALQLAGAVAAQATSVAQMFGEGLTADPQPAFSNLLTIAGIALAFALGLPAYAAAALVGSYEVIPFGTFPFGGDVAHWGARRVGGAFATAIAIATPFMITAFGYYLALGAINKAMPQLMVAFVGAPAITAGALLLMFLAAPPAISLWGAKLTTVLLDPYGAFP